MLAACADGIAMAPRPDNATDRDAALAFSHAIPHDRLRQVMKKYNRLIEK
jgi:hypothetical protein